MHKVLHFDQYKLEHYRASPHRINLLDSSSGKAIAEGLKLQEVYDFYIKPGHMLYCCQQFHKTTAENVDKLKQERVYENCNNYAIVQAHSTHFKLPALRKMKKKKGEEEEQEQQKGQITNWDGIKEIHLNLSSPVEYWKMSLDRAYQFVESGHPVEMNFRIRGKHTSKQERLLPGPSDRWPWLHNYFPHMRPDFILKAMPEGTFFLVKPVSDGRHVQWVMALPTKQHTRSFDLTKKLLKVKEGVKKSIEQGKQPGLPTAMRLNLINDGHEEYSLESDKPRDAARSLRDEDIRFGSQSLDSISAEKMYRLSTMESAKQVTSAVREGRLIFPTENRYMAPRKGSKAKGEWKHKQKERAKQRNRWQRARA